MRRSLCFAFVLVGTLAVYACKEDESRPPAANNNGAPNIGTGGGSSSGSSGEGGVTDSGGVDDSGDAGACNALTTDGTFVDENRVVGPAAPPTGGSIPDGTYDLTEVQLYIDNSGTPGPSGVTYRGILKLTNGKLERLIETVANQGAQPIPSRTYGDLVANGVDFTFNVTQTCPVPFIDENTYSVISNKLTYTSKATNRSFTFTPR